MRVLLVEDNDDDALLIRESLSETTLEIDRAERLSTALAQLTRGKFDAVLLDLSLPDAWGLDTIRRLRHEAAAVPIVVLTGLNDEEIAMRAVEEGAQDYLFKGQADGHLLARSLRYAIQRHRAEETLKERNRELLILQKISETILGSLDLKAVLEKIWKKPWSVTPSTSVIFDYWTLAAKCLKWSPAGATGLRKVFWVTGRWPGRRKASSPSLAIVFLESLASRKNCNNAMAIEP